MRVGKTGGARGASSRGPIRRGGEFPGASEAGRAEATVAPTDVAPTGGVGLADSLLAIEDRRRAIERGKASLDCLDQLRLDILDGELRQATAARLARLVNEGGDEMLDPELRETVEEIRTQLRFEAARLARGARREAGG